MPSLNHSESKHDYEMKCKNLHFDSLWSWLNVFNQIPTKKHSIMIMDCTTVGSYFSMKRWAFAFNQLFIIHSKLNEVSQAFTKWNKKSFTKWKILLFSGATNSQRFQLTNWIALQSNRNFSFNCIHKVWQWRTSKHFIIS